NAGRATAGIDGKTALLPQSKAALADWVQLRARPWSPRPVKRVYVPKPDGRRRGLGIPVIADRALQGVTSAALEPEWEARFESRSYGFRPGRGCQDAIQAIYVTARGASCKRLWVLDADLAAAFDRIDQDHLLASLGAFPARGLVRQWLKAGVVERGHFTPTEEGTPQGGVISPVLLNVALHGMEQAAGVRYHPSSHRDAGTAVPGSPVLVRYADDLVALCHSREQAHQVKARLAEWLAPRGLAFNEDKTRIVHLDEGCDFLGFNIRRYRAKLLIKPSDAAVKRIRKRLAAEMLALRGANAEAVLIKLNPIIRGWAAYYRHVVSSRAFNDLDDYLWKLTYKWAKHTHPHKPKKWITARYFGRFNRFRQDRWVFGDRQSGAFLLKFFWTKIVRHVLVKGWASPDDPTLTGYWNQRRRRSRPPLDRTGLSLLQVQHGRCPLCRDLLLHADHEPQTPQEWERWLTTVRKAIHRQAITTTAGLQTPDTFTLRLVHTHCRRRTGNGSTALLPTRAPSGLA
ncbi:group II intron reverse transcriptase/maturase, partial [Streptomyces mirabilis]|uniref:group II intron reverse transcriptase/maturase n=1 Tax=Streptomyces mirabilis TaxID=68239 RepID=UPI003660F303